jgi:hypothetical protein
MSDDVHGVIADWLYGRGLEDEDGFSKRAASAVSSLKGWDAPCIRAALIRTTTDLFRRNGGVRKSEVCDELAKQIAARCKSAESREMRSAKKCTIVFFASNPRATTQLDLAEEVRAIGEKIRAAKFRDTIELITAWAARPDDLLQYLNEHEATIIHFSGHGSGATGLVMQDDSGQPTLVGADALGALFKTLKRNVRLVVLNACDSLVQAKAIAKEIDCVIAMRAPIGDEAARVFAASLYRAIGFGRSIHEAFDQGKASLMLHGIPEADTPVLICRKGVHTSSVNLIQD